MKKRYSSSRVEWEYIGKLIDAIDNRNIQSQVSNALEWYVIKASRYRMIEYCLNVVNLLVPAILVILNGYVQDNSIVGQLITAVAGICAAAVKSFSKLHDKRICYRRAAEDIKRETALYIHRSGIYTTEGRDLAFVNKINEIGKNENDSWVDIENSAKSAKPGCGRNFTEEEEEEE